MPRVLRPIPFALAFILVFSVLRPGSAPVRAAGEVAGVWLTTSDRSRLLQAQTPVSFAADRASHPVTIDVNESLRYQTMDGFGSSLTDSSAWLIANRMSATQRETLLRNLFTTGGSGIGLSILRQPLGASDFALSNYNYDNTCCDLSDFSVDYEMAYIVPVLKQIQSLSPQVLIMGTPWSAPGWMKTSGSMNGGSLQYAYYKTHAQYFVKWIQAYQAEGLPIWAITPQNEPMHETSGYPTMKMEAGDQASFVKNDLGPALQAAGLSTKIVIFDHNWSLVSYPTTVLNDPTAKSFAAGSGFHCYGGAPSAQTTLHDAFPDRDIWHTECSDGTWIGNGTFAALFHRNMREMVIGVTRHWSKGTIKWNLALDTNHGPTNGGCPTCIGTVTIDQATGGVTYNAEYYALGHASKFVRRGAHRIASNTFDGGIETVAFRNPDGGKVLVVYNAGTAASDFKVRWAGQAFTYTLPSRAAATFTWSTAVTPTPTPTLTPTVTPTPPSGLIDITPAASGVTASAHDGNLPANTVDDLLSTRWSANGDGQWIRYDLGSRRAVAHVRIAVYNGNTRRNRFDLQVSDDGSAWSSVLTGVETSGLTTQLETHDFGDVSARYVRYLGHMSSVNTFNSLTEVQIWGAAATPTPTPTRTPTPTPVAISPTAWYQLINQTSGKCVDDAGWGTTSGAAVQQWACGASQANQQWQFQATSDGYYRVANRHAPTLVLDVTGGASATGNGVLIQLWTYGGGSNQQWLPQPMAGGYYRLVARHSGRCLDVPSASTADGVRLQQYDCSGSGKQSFRLVSQP